LAKGKSKIWKAYLFSGRWSLLPIEVIIRMTDEFMNEIQRYLDKN
jgi:hypothetical protein